MRIVSASIDGFRNLVAADFSFSPQVNIFLGRNGEGKTNLLEALNYFALGRSHRGAKTDELIHFSGEHLHVALEIEEDHGETISCQFGIGRKGGHRTRINGKNIRRRADLVGRLATVFFDPESILLVQGGPGRRRQFTDQGMAEIDSLFLHHLAAFQRALKQKAGILREAKKGVLDYPSTRRELVAWNHKLAGHIAVICIGRKQYTDDISPFAHSVHNTLINKELKLSFSYSPQMTSAVNLFTKPTNVPVSKDDLEEDILAELDYIMEAEIRRGRPLCGPQMDDFHVSLDGVDLRVYGSQGEKRTAAIALILARSDVLFAKKKIRPILFFDDIFSELDRERTRRLQEMAACLHQVFIATARHDDIEAWRPPQMKTWLVENGCFTEV